MEWERVYAELTNKFRWAIGSTVDATLAGSINLPYRSQQDLARSMASELVERLKAMYEKPNLVLGASPRSFNGKSTETVPKTH